MTSNTADTTGFGSKSRKWCHWHLGSLETQVLRTSGAGTEYDFFQSEELLGLELEHIPESLFLVLTLSANSFLANCLKGKVATILNAMPVIAGEKKQSNQKNITT